MQEIKKSPSAEALLRANLDLGAELEQRGMFCLHGVVGVDLGLNNAVAPGTSLEDRFRIVVADEPPIATAVYKKEVLTNHVSIWGNIGVVIRAGEIQFAGDDAGSTVVGTDRVTQAQTTEEISQGLNAIERWQETFLRPKVNEVVVRKPIVSGLYFKESSGLMPHEINRDQTVAEPNHIPKILRDLSLELKLPVYTIRHTGLYVINAFDENGRYNFVTNAERVEPEELRAVLRQGGEAF